VAINAGADAATAPQFSAPSTTSGAATASTTPDATPATQLASALVGFTTTGTSNTVTVQLQPAELGKVQISVTTDVGGPSTVQIVAERPETLALLQRDQAQLSQALDQAGIGTASRTLSFSLAAGTAPNVAATPTQAGNNMTAVDAAHNGGGPTAGTSATASAPAVSAAEATVTAPPSAGTSATPTGTVATPAAFSANLQNGSSQGGAGNENAGNSTLPSLQNPSTGAGAGPNGGSGGGNSSGHQGFWSAQPLPDDTGDILGDDISDAAAGSLLPTGLNILA
jgi:hypothetical protein